jgi:uncharacterized RDD family membrane protein YckC
MTSTNVYAPPRAVVHDVAVVDGTGTPADRGTRLVASILDGIIFMGMVYLPFIIAALAAPNSEGETGSDAIVIVGVGIGVIGLIAWCWLTVVYVQRNGQTIAKKLLTIKVVRSDGSPASLGRIFWLRNVVNGIASVIPLYGLIDALFIFGESRQCLHDKIADTIVIKA